MSSLSDVAGTGEGKRRGRTPKENVSCEGFLGDVLKKYITVIFSDVALSEETESYTGSDWSRYFYAGFCMNLNSGGGYYANI